MHDRHARRFAAEIPQRDMDGGDGSNRSPAPAGLDGLAVHLRPEMFRIEGARAYQHGKKDGVHHRDHGLTAVIAERESFASESVFGGDANDQVIAMRDATDSVRHSGSQGYRYRQCFDFGNFHELTTIQEGASEFYSLAL